MQQIRPSAPSTSQTLRSADPSADRVALAAFLLVFSLIVIPGRTQLLCDPGVFWHVVVGDRILSQQALIHHDPFSFTFAGQPWIAQQWLAECLMSVIHFCAGLSGLVIVGAALVAVIFAEAANRFRRVGLHMLPTLALVLLATAAVAGHLHARPHLATMALLAFTMTRLIDCEQQRISVRRLWRLVPLYVLWTNLHGGMLGGLVSVGMAAFGWTACWRAGFRSPITTWSQAFELAALMVTLAATCLINPYGLKLPATWIYLTQTDLTFIAEHAPLDLSSAIGQLTLVMAAIYGLVLCRVPRRTLEVSWLLPCAWFVLGLSHIRHAPLFSLSALLVLAEALPSSAWAGPLKHRGWMLPALPTDRLRRSWSWIRPAVLLTTVLFLAATGWHFGLSRELWAQPCEEYWPEDVLPAVQEFALEHPEGTRIFNEMAFGGFLLYNAPRLRVFVDDRCELYGEEFLRQCLASYQFPDRLQSWVTEFGIEVALVRRGSSFDRKLAEWPEWELVSSGTANLYRHR